MKKVLFVATITKHIIGFHTPYLKWFKEQGYEVHVASRGNEKIEYCDKHYDLPFERFPLKKNNLKAYRELKKIINDNEYEIIHCHTPVGGVLTRLAARQVRKKGTKVIYTAHGFHFYKGAPIKNWLIYYPIEKICAHFTDCLITITEEDYEFAKKKIKTKKIEHVYGVGMIEERFNKDITDLEKEKKRKELNINQKDIVFTYVAELNKNKNQTLLIESIEQLRKKYSNIKLLLVGDGAWFNIYKKMIEDRTLSDSILLLGRRKDINDILSITDIYLASSLREGLPINVMEAMYKKLPIIAMDNRGHRELVQNEKNGCIVYNLEEMIEKIELLLKDEVKRIEFENFSYDNIDKYLLSNVLQQMIKIYENQLEKR